MTPEQRQHMIDTAPNGGKVVFLEDMAFADTKAIFAADGTFNVNPDLSLTVAAVPVGGELVTGYNETADLLRRLRYERAEPGDKLANSSLTEVLSLAAGTIESLTTELRAAGEVEVTEDMVECMARVLFARTTEGRQGSTWPLNGGLQRQRDMKDARKALARVLGLAPVEQAGADR